MGEPGVALDSFDRAARALVRSTYTVALLGSARPPGQPAPASFWSKPSASDGLSFQHFMDDPARWWWLKLGHPEDRGLARPAPPTPPGPGPAEAALAALETVGALRHVISQADDGRHFRAGSRSVTEVRGNQGRLRCIECLTRFDLGEIAMHPIPPRCPRCQGLIKSDALLHGEPLPSDVVAAAKEQIARCDALIVLDAAGLDHPIASLALAAQRRGAWLIEISPRETPLTTHCDAAIPARADSALPYLLERLQAFKQGIAAG